MKIHNMPQGSQEWLDIRCGKWTASNFHSMLFGNNGKNNKTSITKQNMLFEKAAERITGTLSDNMKFTNHHIERGHELESEARAMYELETNSIVEEIGFVELNSYIGSSPDGFIGKDGIIEIKCPDHKGFLERCLNEKVTPVYQTQIQFNLYICQRQWCDYILYNPNFRRSLHIKRIERDEDYIQRIKECLDVYNKEVDHIISEYNDHLFIAKNE